MQTLDSPETIHGEEYRVLGESIRCIVPSEATGGACAVVEQITPAGGGMPPHVHHHEDILLCLVEGELELHCGGAVEVLTPGKPRFLPRGIVHGYRNSGTAPARSLLTIIPGGFEHVYKKLHRLPHDPEIPPRRMVEIAEHYGFEYSYL